jgi:hypothetical protein
MLLSLLSEVRNWHIPPAGLFLLIRSLGGDVRAIRGGADEDARGGVVVETEDLVGLLAASISFDIGDANLLGDLPQKTNVFPEKQ